MSRFIETQNALDVRLSTLTSSPPVAWENSDYTPVDGTSYLRPINLPISADPVGIANTDSTRGIGYYQVDVFTPARGGPATALNIGDRIAAHFSRGLRLIDGDTTVIVGVPTHDAARLSGAWHMVSVLIPYDTLYK